MKGSEKFESELSSEIALCRECFEINTRQVRTIKAIARKKNMIPDIEEKVILGRIAKVRYLDIDFHDSTFLVCHDGSEMSHDELEDLRDLLNGAIPEGLLSLPKHGVRIMFRRR